MVAFIIIILVGALAYKGAALALKTQIPLMVLVGISIIVLALGAIQNIDSVDLTASVPSGEVTFWAAFAAPMPSRALPREDLRYDPNIRNVVLSELVPVVEDLVLVELDLYWVFIVVRVVVCCSDACVPCDHRLVTELLGPWLQFLNDEE